LLELAGQIVQAYKWLRSVKCSQGHSPVSSTKKSFDTLLGLATATSVVITAALWAWSTNVSSQFSHIESERLTLVLKLAAEKHAQSEAAARAQYIPSDPSDFDISGFPPKVATEIAHLENPRFGFISMRWLDSNYAALFRELKLPAAQLERLKALLVDRQRAAMEALRLGGAEDLVIDDMPDEKEILEAGTKDIDEAISRELGDDAYDTFKDYQSSMSARRFMVKPFADHLSFASQPLTDAQVDQLATAASQVPFGANVIIMRPPGPEIPASVDVVAANVLSASQQAAYQDYKSYWTAQRQVEAANLGQFVARQIALANAQPK
jgi:hypothetical protein